MPYRIFVKQNSESVQKGRGEFKIKDNRNINYNKMNPPYCKSRVSFPDSFSVTIVQEEQSSEALPCVASNNISFVQYILDGKFHPWTDRR